MSSISKQDKIVASIVSICVLAFFGILASKCNPLDSTPNSNTKATPSGNTEPTKNSPNELQNLEGLQTHIAGLEEKITALEKTNQELTTSLAKQPKQNQTNPTNSSSAHSSEANETLQQKNIELQEIIKITETKVQRLNEQVAELMSSFKEASAVIQPNEGESLAEASARMLKQLESRTRVLTEKQAELEIIKKELTQLKNQPPEAQDEAVRNQIAKLQKSQKEALTKVKILTAKLEQKETEAEHASKLVLAARKQQALVQAKNKQIQSLRAKINQLYAISTTFVDSPDALPKSAKNLFTDLEKLEGKPRNEVENAYQSYQKNHKATSVMKIKFASGKADISKEDIAKIKEVSNTSGDNSYFLVVGFADKTGNAEANKTLSSKRSTNVALELNKQKKGLQAAQAVYLGQTSRFGKPEENRVVEIWRIN